MSEQVNHYFRMLIHYLMRKDYNSFIEDIGYAKDELNDSQYRELGEMIIDFSKDRDLNGNFDLYDAIFCKAKSSTSQNIEKKQDKIDDISYSNKSSKKFALNSQNLLLPSQVCTDGSGPYEEDFFDDMLRNMNIEVFGINEAELDIIIIGKHEWSKENIVSHIESRRGQHLKVYSQEMFLSYIALLQFHSRKL